jgi:hypothetical protein
MKRVALGLFALAMAVAQAPSAMATAIIGQAAIAGAEKVTATGVTFPNQGTFVTADAALASLFNQKVTLNAFTFANPQNTILFDASGFDFKILTMAVSLNNHNFLNLGGTGTLTLNGMDPTPFIFNLSSSHTADDIFAYGFTIAPASAVPEPASLLLVGSGLLGFAGLLFRKARKTVSRLPG